MSACNFVGRYLKQAEPDSETYVATTTSRRLCGAHKGILVRTALKYRCSLVNTNNKLNKHSTF